jgi:DNA-directed RNA polymerase specialized sigma24 family protein
MTDAELIEAVSPQLAHMAGRLGGRNSGGLDADDLMQEGLIAALGSRATWAADGGASLPTHAVNRGRGAIIDAIRRAARHCSRSSGRLVRLANVCAVSCLTAPPNVRPDWWHPSARPDVPDELEQAARVLFAGHAAVVAAVLSHVRDGERMDSAAAGMGVKRQTVYARTNRAYRRVRATYTRHQAAELLGVS